jgi:hypothetical protein
MPTGTTAAATGSGLNIQVTQFTVASNFEIRGQFNATNNGKTNIQDLAPTRIQVKRPSGEVVFDAAAPSIQGSVMDTKPMAGLPPGMSRPYSFSAAPGTISKQVTEGEEVTGIITLSADGQVIEVSLPVTKVTPIRIPWAHGLPDTRQKVLPVEKWVEAGVFLKLWKAGVQQFDELQGLEWEWLSMDGAMTKAPLGGGKNRAQSDWPRQERDEA